MIKTVFGCLLLVLSFAEIRAQFFFGAKKGDRDISRFKLVHIDIKPPEDQFSFHWIKNITVIDARLDTSIAGVKQRLMGGSAFLTIKGGVKHGIQDWLNRNSMFTKQDSGYLILMVLKKCFLSDVIKRSRSEDEQRKRFSTQRFYSSGVISRIEFYVQKKDAFYALYRFDSTIADKERVTYFAGDYLQNLLTESLQKLIKMDSAGFPVENRRPLNYDQIKEFNHLRLDVPVLLDTTFVHGVFMNFEEFKQNKPSIRNFEIKKKKLEDFLMVTDENGKSYREYEAWGYSDGNKLFIRAGENFFQLQRRNNVFYIFGSDHLTTISQNSYGTGSTFAFPTSSQELISELLQLDWDTGKLY